MAIVAFFAGVFCGCAFCFSIIVVAMLPEDT